MHFFPKCLEALEFPGCWFKFPSLKYTDFWESVDEPSLRKFLDFRLSAGDLKDEATEYHRYITELATIKKYYTEASEMGGNILKWMNLFKVNVQFLLLKHFGQSLQPEYTEYPAGCVLAVGTGASLSVRTCSTDSKTQVLVRGCVMTSKLPCQPEYTDYPAGCVLAVGTGASLSVRTCSTDSKTQVLVRGWLIF
ncbi:hypothetical protein BC936DRAFT_140975 [Jimgerdemannia flammicorona]|uniref:Uncharacterized protein n=1 Tax=Jimgerdemannia flammicorona TaxID=994334 RepID=A0A433DGE1_9FUNG|nr:hypothetical protein BC936DRAFT_140975 [Jimgerdemannia flammicorona]